MAKTSKRKRSKTKSSGLNVTSIKEKINNKVHDRKFRTYWGLFFILLSVLLLISFTSFIYTWKEDQDILDMGWIDYLFNSSVNTENLAGKAGLLLSNIFIYNWFGISSYLFSVLFFLLGMRFFNVYKKSLLTLTKNILFPVLWFSICLAAIFGNETDIAGGKFGFQIHLWLKSLMGVFGEVVLLVITMTGFLMMTVESVNTKVRGFFEKLFSEGFLSGLFKKSPVNDVSETVNTTKEKQIKDEISKEKLRIHDFEDDEDYEDEEFDDGMELDIEDGKEKAIKIIEKKNYKLTDDGKKVEHSDDFGFEVENTGLKEQIERELANVDDVGKFNDFDEKEKIEKEKLLLHVTENRDTISEQIGSLNVNFDPTLDLSHYTIPSVELLEDHQADNPEVGKEELLRNKNRIVETLKHYNIEIQKIKATIGPTLTLYEIVPAPGVRISKIKNLEDDIALSLAAHGIRIIAPMPGRGTIGIEVPNEKPDIVSFKSVIKTTVFQESKMELPIALGKTISNEAYVFDLAKMPHLLVAGATGQGKSVGLNAMIASLLYKKHPAQLKFVLVDPKKVELTLYEKLENHFIATLPDAKEPIITDNHEVIHVLSSLNVEMDDRYQLLKKANVRTIIEYNKKFTSRQLNPENGHHYLPYIVVVIDEFADLIMTAGKEIELPIARLAQLARAIGIHLIVATQRPSTNIITGTIKANFPARIAFRVASMIDSRTILDSPGANRLIGRGDMLITQGSDMIRLQCAFIDTPELERLTKYISEQQAYPMPFLLPEPIVETEGDNELFDLDKRDELFNEAAKIIVMNQQGSTSLIQRKLSIGYNRAGRIIDQMEAAGIVGPSKGSKARDVYIMDDYALEKLLNSLP
jgi:S-DNA-T family DNA segregation ATPase FtsK/SpoIIIE